MFSIQTRAEAGRTALRPRRGNQRHRGDTQVTAPRFTEDEVAAALGGPVSPLGSGSYGDTRRYRDTAGPVRDELMLIFRSVALERVLLGGDS